MRERRSAVQVASSQVQTMPRQSRRSWTSQAFKTRLPGQPINTEKALQHIKESCTLIGAGGHFSASACTAPKSGCGAASDRSCRLWHTLTGAIAHTSNTYLGRYSSHRTWMYSVHKLDTPWGQMQLWRWHPFPPSRNCPQSASRHSSSTKPSHYRPVHTAFGCLIYIRFHKSTALQNSLGSQAIFAPSIYNSAHSFFLSPMSGVKKSLRGTL